MLQNLHIVNQSMIINKELYILPINNQMMSFSVNIIQNLNLLQITFRPVKLINIQMSMSFEYRNLTFSCQKLILKMKKTWKTSHSSSNERINFLITISNGNKIGQGEAGLPPKKPGCYLADINDCFTFFELFKQRLISEQLAIDHSILNIQDFFLSFKTDQNKQIFYRILSALHSFHQPCFRAAISAFEFAIFSLWAHILNKPLLECIYGQALKLSFNSYYSVSIGETQVQDAKETSKLTPFIKLKCQNDFVTVSQTLANLIKSNVGDMIVLDANASWTVQTTKKIIEFISQNKYQNRIECLQQPFEINPSIEWKEVLEFANKNSVRIMADESFSGSDDVIKIKELSNGANIKIQKAGGLLKSIKSILKAKEANLDIWLGIMMSSWLGCTQTFMLSPLAPQGDLDGGYILLSPFQAGFIMNEKGQVYSREGVGLAVKQIQVIDDTKSQ